MHFTTKENKEELREKEKTTLAYLNEHHGIKPGTLFICDVDRIQIKHFNMNVFANNEENIKNILNPYPIGLAPRLPGGSASEFVFTRRKLDRQTQDILLKKYFTARKNIGKEITIKTGESVLFLGIKDFADPELNKLLANRKICISSIIQDLKELQSKPDFKLQSEQYLYVKFLFKNQIYFIGFTAFYLYTIAPGAFFFFYSPNNN